MDEIRRAELPQRDKRLRSGIDRLVEDLFGQAERGLAMRRLGRFAIGGADALAFLQYILSNNAAALEVGQAQYTFIPSETGGAIDDAYLYRFVEGEYLLVGNASNRHKDWDHLREHLDLPP